MSKLRRLIGANIGDRYTITGKIGSGGMGYVFRAMPYEDPSEQVAIKVVQKGRGFGPESLLRFQREAALMSQLHHPNIVSFHELGLLEGNEKSAGALGGTGYYIVMDIAHGQDLKAHLASVGRIDLGLFFELASQISSALVYTHGKNIIHRDIKPQNIIVGSHSSGPTTVKVLDFGVSRLAEVMEGDGGAAGYRWADVAGTPMYMAPEHSSRFDAPVDHRLDLYSLGCVLYEALAGRPVFLGPSKERFIHQHLEESPEPLSAIRPDLPGIVCEIIHKLLEKHPNDRYQTAFGLHADLVKTYEIMSQRRRLISFPLAMPDKITTVGAQIPLIGRDGELALLKEHFDQVSKARARSRMTILKGEAGAGKSRLLSEFQSFLVRHSCRFIRISFSRHENNLPYNALANGFNEFLSRLMKRQPHQADELKSRMRTVMGPKAHGLADVIQGLKAYTTDIPEEPPSEGGEEDFQHFVKVFSDFTSCLTVDHQPIVFLLDDMHWADEKSLQIIDAFFSYNNSQRFLLVITHRASETFHAGGFQTFLNKFSKLRRRYGELSLGMLNREETGRLIDAIVGVPEGSLPATCADLVFAKSAGNPLYAFEMVKEMVSHGVLGFQNQRWVFDHNLSLTTPLTPRTIDLAIYRIDQLSAGHKSLLERMAVAGMSFYEGLIWEKATRGMQETVLHFIDLGFITKDPGHEEHLGALYRFSHRRIRGLVYDRIDVQRRRELHLDFAKKLDILIPNPGSHAILQLAHHINQAFAEYDTITLEIATMCVTHNIKAGKLARKSRSWQSAQSYFEKAFHVVESDLFYKALSGFKYEIMENLAEIAVLRKQNSLAMTYYQSLEKMGPDRTKLSLLYARMAYIYMVNGQVSKTLGILGRCTKRLGLIMPRFTNVALARFFIRLAFNTLVFKFKGEPMMRVIKKVAKRRGDRSSWREGSSYVRLYNIGTYLHVIQDKRAGILFNERALDAAHVNCQDGEAVLRALIDRAVILGHLGLHERAYKLMGICLDVARFRDFHSTYGYGVLMQILTLDHYKTKHEIRENRLKKALLNLSETHDRTWYVQGLIFNMYSHLIAGRTRAVRDIALDLPKHIPTRNRLSAQGMALYFFAVFLEHDRKLLVVQGDDYLGRRKAVGGRGRDYPVLVIDVLVSLAKGEGDVARKVYGRLVKTFCDKDTGYLFPFEEDFLSLFLTVIPEFYSAETGKALLTKSDMKILYQKLLGRIQKIRGHSRPLPQTLIARIRDRLGKADIKRGYDLALMASKAHKQRLPEILIYYWFGRYLITESKGGRSDYIRRVHQRSTDMGLIAIANFAERIMDHYKITYVKASSLSGEDPGRAVSEVSEHLQIAYPHLRHVAEAIGRDQITETSLNDSIALLGRFIGFDSAYCLVYNERQGEAEFLYPTNDIPQGILEFIGPYLHIKSTLFLPVATQPYGGGNPGGATVIQDQTEVIGDVTQASPIPGGTVAESAADHGRMNILVPLYLGGGAAGMLMLTGWRPGDNNSVRLRLELDKVGSQMGFMLQQKIGPSIPSRRYAAAAYTLESCSWLKLWTQGRMRKEREEVWFLGLNASDHEYLLVYFRADGPGDIRLRLGRELWSTCHALRNQVASSGLGGLNSRDLKDQVTGLLTADAQFRDLEGVSVAFTIFDREGKTATSGHFGMSRPVVLCQENLVTPENTVVARLQNGKQLRYWQVTASLDGPHLYLLSHDTSKIDQVAKNTLEKSFPTRNLGELTSSGLRSFLERLALKDNIPRYYVGAVLLGSSDQGEASA